MSEFEDKLQSILGNPEAMDQIMSIARSITGTPPASQDPDPPSELCPQSSHTESDLKDPLALLNGLDPKLLQIGMRLLSEYNNEDNRTVALLTALQPFVRPERYAKMDKAVQIAKLSRFVRVAVESFRKGDSDFV